MYVGCQVDHYRNINLKWSIPKTYWARNMKPEHALKDPEKGIVLKKFKGQLVRILEDGEELTYDEIEQYSNNNHIMVKSFELGSKKKGLRVVVEFPENRIGRYKIFHQNMWEKRSKDNIMGYVEIIPNSIRFIKEA